MMTPWRSPGRNQFSIMAGACLMLGVGGCQVATKPTPVVEVQSQPQAEWKRLIEERHVQRLAQIDRLWSELVKVAHEDGHGRRLLKSLIVLDPRAALPRPAPTPGAYLCRIIKLHRANERGPRLRAYKQYFCYIGVSDDTLSLTKQGGSDQPTGYLYEDGGRLVFLGSMAASAEDPAPAYGEIATRDAVGVFERIGHFKFRLVLPAPPDDASLTIVELVPSELQPGT